MNKLISILVTLLVITSIVFGGCTGTPSTTQSQNIIEAKATLQSISSDLSTIYDQFGIDEDVADYILFVASLPEDFRDYALQNKLCIQDRKLTELEKQFLQEPEKYLQQMFDSYMADSSNIDPELATQLKKLPYFKTIELEDIEALEDVLYLASDPQYGSTLETIYGKGIERNMWPVALEAMVYRGMRSEKNEFDTNNPLESTDLIILTRLANFQAKYNTEMDMEGISSPKPTLKGINYISEPRNELTKNEIDYKFDYALIRWVLRANSVRLWNNGDPELDSLVFHHIDLALDEGLEIYLQFTQQPNIDLETYKSRLAAFAKKAQNYNIRVLSVGNEVEFWLQEFGGGAWTSWNSTQVQSRQNGDVERFVDELAEIAGENYSGLLTYTDCWNFWTPEYKDLNWGSFSIISLNTYKCKNDDETFLDYLRHMKAVYASPFNKPLYITELGSLTITEAEDAGGDDSYTWRLPVHYDSEKQAQVIDTTLKLVYQVGVDGVFIFCWDRSTYNNQNELGFGIWDYVKKAPKLSFWTLYKYFRE